MSLLRLLVPAVLVVLVALPPARARAAGFGIEAFQAAATEADGSPDHTAGSHPYQLLTSIDFEGGAGLPAGDPRNLSLELPSGLVEDPRALARCTQAEFDSPRSSPYEPSLSGESCRSDSQVGTLAVHTSLAGVAETRTFGLFSLVPAPGAPYQIGASPFGVPIVFTPRLRDAGGGFGITLEATNLTQAFPIDGLELTVWGTPWDYRHDTERGNCLNETEPAAYHGEASRSELGKFVAGTCWVGKPVLVPPQEYTEEPQPQSYLSLPASCAAPLSYAVRADSWQGGSAAAGFAGAALQQPSCEHLSFLSFPAATLSDRRASSASGFAFDLAVNQEGLVNPAGTAQPQMKEAVVSLPEGVTINPSLAAGLGVCTPAQYAAASPTAQGCPDAAKIGDFRVGTPLLLEGPLEGSIFLAAPYRNPFGSLVAVYLIARSPERGLVVELPGRLAPDPLTGRVTATFEELPQLPYRSLEVHFREGQRAPLATPAACGPYTTAIELHPWLAPQAAISQAAPFQIAAGAGGGPCPPPGPPPFGPRAVGGSINAAAGAYSPFYLHLSRGDTEQEITSYSATLPPGLLGNLSGIPWCPDADIAAAKAASGTEEAAHPSCPEASRIGHTTAGYGLGGVLAYAPGELYLAGPYRGAPLSIVAVDPALVGPFDLGTIVVRSAIRVDPHSAQVSIDTRGENPFPHILDGIPIHLRDVRVYVDRPGFTLNPTSCDPLSLTSELSGSAPPFTAAGASASVAGPYQVIGCSALGFGPGLSLRLRGNPGRGSHPALRAEVTERPGDADIGGALVTLTRTEFLAQSHIREVCTERQFAAGACPPGSVYGHARAITPLLPEPLEGPVYLRSNGGARPLPDLVVALRGDGGIAIDLVGYISSHRGGMQAGFSGLPDAPASRFVLTLRGGRHGLLENAVDICRTRTFATARFVGQDNSATARRVPLKGRCGRRGGRRPSHRRHPTHRHRSGRG